MSMVKEALKSALCALESERIMGADDQGNYTVEITSKRIQDAIAKIKAALTVVEQEPVAWLLVDKHNVVQPWREPSVVGAETDEQLDTFNRAFPEGAPFQSVPLVRSTDQPRETQHISLQP